MRSRCLASGTSSTVTGMTGSANPGATPRFPLPQANAWSIWRSRSPIICPRPGASLRQSPPTMWPAPAATGLAADATAENTAFRMQARNDGAHRLAVTFAGTDTDACTEDRSRSRAPAVRRAWSPTKGGSARPAARTSWPPRKYTIAFDPAPAPTEKKRSIRGRAGAGSGLHCQLLPARHASAQPEPEGRAGRARSWAAATRPAVSSAAPMRGRASSSR